MTMTKPYEPPSFGTVQAWRAKLREACEKLETFPASELQTATVLLVSDVAHQMQGVIMDYDAGQHRETETSRHLPAYRKRPVLTHLQAHWMLVRAVSGKGEVSDRAMAEWNGEVEPDPTTLNPPDLIR